MASIELAQKSVREARVRLELVRGFVRGSHISDTGTEPHVRELLAGFERYVRLQEDHWEALLNEKDRRSTLHIIAASALTRTDPKPAAPEGQPLAV
jgi:hypothetical protein